MENGNGDQMKDERVKTTEAPFNGSRQAIHVQMDGTMRDGA